MPTLNWIAWLLLCVVLLLSGLAGAYLGDRSGRRVSGFLFGLLFLPLAILAVVAAALLWQSLAGPSIEIAPAG